MKWKWKPGDVLTGDGGGVFFVCGAGSAVDVDSVAYRPDSIEGARRLVVIDPERVAGPVPGPAQYIAASLREADENNDVPTFRALADAFDPPRPRPDEPTGLGAVVEDDYDKRWVRAYDAVTGNPAWRSADFSGTYRTYDTIDVVRVLSEGV